MKMINKNSCSGESIEYVTVFRFFIRIVFRLLHMLMQSVDNPTTQKFKGAVKLDNRKRKRNAVGAHPWL